MNRISLPVVLALILVFSCKKDNNPSAVVISSFTPASGPVGTTVTITGQNFSDKLTDNAVTFGSVAAVVSAATTTALTVAVPTGAATGKISVTTRGTKVTSSADFTVSISNPGPGTGPVISSFSPTGGPIGTTVTINGQNFSDQLTGNAVKFGSVASVVSAATTTTLTVAVPTGATTGKISVTTGTTTATSSADFTVSNLSPPVISNFSPASGPIGTTVTITGQNFSGQLTGNAVKFGNVVAVVSAATTTTLTVAVPASATTGKISVTTNGITATSSTDFTISGPTPVITSFSPLSGPIGATVIITGQNFSITNNVVKFGSTAAVVSAATTTSLTVTVPIGASTGKISVTTDGGTATSSADFTVLPPVISSFSPAGGSIGTTVTITGQYFSDQLTGNAVKFGSVDAVVSAATTTTLTVAVPAGAATGKISVTTNGLTATSSNDFAISDPTFISFAPVRALSGATVTISGSNFSPVANLNVVKFNGVNATVSTASATSLSVVVPNSSTTGKITVTVDTKTATSATDFEVIVDIPRNGLIAFYPFNGNANDESGNSLNGTVSNASLTTDRYGNASKAYAFNGTSSYISLGNPALLQLSGTITVAVWMKMSDLATYSVLSKETGYGDACKGYMLTTQKVSTVGRFGLEVNNNPGTNYLDGSININDWVFVTVTLDGTVINSYVNGQLGTTASGSKLLVDCAAADMIIGATSAHNGSFFYGSLDDMFIYNRAISAAEVQQLYAQTITKY